MNADDDILFTRSHHDNSSPTHMSYAKRYASHVTCPSKAKGRGEAKGRPSNGSSFCSLDFAVNSLEEAAAALNPVLSSSGKAGMTVH